MSIENKIVLWHAESDSYMYCHSDDERDVLIADAQAGGADLTDVSALPDHVDRAALQLGPWQIDANEKQDTDLVLASGEIETTEGTLIILSGNMVEIPQHIYDAHKEEIDNLKDEENGRHN